MVAKIFFEFFLGMIKWVPSSGRAVLDGLMPARRLLVTMILAATWCSLLNVFSFPWLLCEPSGVLFFP